MNLVEGLDFYVEDGVLVFTAAYLLRRGLCCGNGCRNCPYDSHRRTESRHATGAGETAAAAATLNAKHKLKAGETKP
ncbi:MAG: hypothetical protein HY721_16010 [Planctomycetes bacterium]|nr:hypothetical protein [Planctomycetota bacterium]